MSRPLRLDYAGAIHHITVRGNARKRIFRDSLDRQALCKRLAASAKHYGVRIFLYCLLDNHFHLVVQTPRANLTRFMQSVLTGYTVCHNLRHRVCGHVTQGRFGARLVAGDDYLRRLSRYVHLNPVQMTPWRERATTERVAALRQHRWSSYLAYAGLASREEWVDYEPLLRLHGGSASRADAAYAEFVEYGLVTPDEAFRQEMERSPRGIGDDRFREWVDARHAEMLENRKRLDDVALRQERETLSPEVVLRTVAGRLKIKPADLKRMRRDWPAKGIAGYLLEKHAGLTRRACAPFLGLRNGSGVAYQIQRAMTVAEMDVDLKRKIEKIEQDLDRIGGT